MDGLEKVDYQREQHVKLIQEKLNKYDKLRTKDTKLEQEMLVKFKLYTAINEISPKELEYRPFEDIVKDIIQKTID